MKDVHFGAGNIGRGFIGQVLHDNHFSLTYLDANDAIINKINEDKGYKIEYLAEDVAPRFIDDAKAINSVKDPEAALAALVEADLITTSVGVNNLKRIAPLLLEGLITRFQSGKAINILANENMINASSALKKEVYDLADEAQKALLDQYAFFANTAIDRQSLAKEEDGKSVALVEPYYEWVIAKSEMDPATSFELENVTFVAEMLPYIERKLYIVNASHAALAYVGAVCGYDEVQKALKDEKISQLVHEFIAENVQYFVKAYGQSEKDMTEFATKTFKRHANPLSHDAISRVGRNPIRKVGGSERLAGPVGHLAELNLANEAGKKVLACAYLYAEVEDEEAVELQKKISEQGYEKIIQELSGFSAELAAEVAALCAEIKEDPQNLFN